LSYYFLDRTTHAASEILSGYPGLSENDLGEMKPYPYTARDGLKIPAYLTLPPGKAGKDLPVVILPHTGPDNRDAIGFDWWVHSLPTGDTPCCNPTIAALTAMAASSRKPDCINGV
jgi:dipeptidyl aminopeptidase/acylaminoacyl peptidase